MYPKRTNDDYTRGEEFLGHSPFFDEYNEVFYENRGPVYDTFSFKVGGLRQRVFGTGVCITKFPFFNYDFAPLGMAPGYHFFQNDGQVLFQSEKIRLLDTPCVLLHFKFIKPRFVEFIERRVANNQDWENSAEYRKYLEVLENGNKLEFYDERYTRRLSRHENLSHFFQKTAG
jgi:hypothetical protein